MKSVSCYFNLVYQFESSSELDENTAIAIMGL